MSQFFCKTRKKLRNKKEVDRCTDFVTETFLRGAMYCILTNVTSQTIIYLNPNPNQKKIPNIGPKFLILILCNKVAQKDDCICF